MPAHLGKAWLYKTKEAGIYGYQNKNFKGKRGAFSKRMLQYSIFLKKKECVK